MRKILILLLCFPLVVHGSENQAKAIINEMEELYRGTSSEVLMTMQVEVNNIVFCRDSSGSVDILGTELELNKKKVNRIIS